MYIVLSLCAMRFTILLFSVITFLSLPACQKDDDTPPSGRIFGQVLHHDDPILGATVYIKYNAQEFPGTSPADYDDAVMASTTDASYSFEGLSAGAYYLYGIGEDTDCTCTVLGGIPVVLSSHTDIRETVVPVTE